MNDAILMQTVTGLFIVCAVYFVLSGIKIRALNRKYNELVLKNKSLQADVSAMCEIVINTGAYTDKPDTNTKNLEVYEPGEPKNRLFRQAGVLLGNGAEIGDVMDNCGISYGEAELLAMMSKLEPRHVGN